MNFVSGFIENAAKNISDRFNRRKSVMSFFEYMELVAETPITQLRNSAKYIADVFEHFGSYDSDLPGGKTSRFRILDGEFPESIGEVCGQEEVMEEIYSIISSFVSQGKVNKLILLHGPNGSAKTSIVGNIIGAMENYSLLPEGALYRFSWVFPKDAISKGGIGFGGKKATKAAGSESFAYLKGSEVASRFASAVADHPLLLLPHEEREAFISTFIEKMPPGINLPEVLLKGDLNPIDKEICDALMMHYGGDWMEVLRHVRVERFYISRRYRRGAATVDPQFAVDASAQQITLDKNISQLPPSLQSLSIFSVSGPLVSAHRGMLEYNDMLKRPVESFKYLLSTSESQQVFISPLILNMDIVFIGTSNERHLDNFKQNPDFQSFKGRFELVKAPYLRLVSQESKIYTTGVLKRLKYRHIGPYVAELVSLWAVLTRLMPPGGEDLPEETRKQVESLLPLEKARLYDKGEAPERFSGKAAKDLRALREALWNEMKSGVIYEGRFGASPREIINVINSAAQNPDYECLTILAIAEELRELVSDKSVYEFLQLETQGDYFKHAAFVETIVELYLDRLDRDFSAAFGLAGKDQYIKLFESYVNNVRAWVKNEKIHDPITGKDYPSDDKLMREVEKKIAPENMTPQEFRHEIISAIGAYSLENAPEKLEYDKIFPDYFHTLEEYYYTEKKEEISKYLNHLQRYIHGDSASIEEKDRKKLEETLSVLNRDYGYCRLCAMEGIDFLIKKRY